MREAWNVHEGVLLGKEFRAEGGVKEINESHYKLANTHSESYGPFQQDLTYRYSRY